MLSPGPEGSGVAPRADLLPSVKDRQAPQPLCPDSGPAVPGVCVEAVSPLQNSLRPSAAGSAGSA